MIWVLAALLICLVFALRNALPLTVMGFACWSAWQITHDPWATVLATLGGGMAVHHLIRWGLSSRDARTRQTASMTVVSTAAVLAGGLSCLLAGGPHGVSFAPVIIAAAGGALIAWPQHPVFV